MVRHSKEPVKFSLSGNENDSKQNLISHKKQKKLRKAMLKSGIMRFPSGHHQSINQLCKHHIYLADLLFSFPGLLFHLSTNALSPDRKKKIIDMICQGAPLKQAAELAGLPLWLKKIPPEAFMTSIGSLPGNEAFARQITNLIPSNTALISPWLERVSQASLLCSNEYALWMARHSFFVSPSQNLLDPLKVLASWAWFSQQKQTKGAKFLNEKWHKKMSLDNALFAAGQWFDRVLLHVFTSTPSLNQIWLPAGKINNIKFKPLTTYQDFHNFAYKLSNCLETYGAKCLGHNIRVYGIESNLMSVGVLEIKPHEFDQDRPAIGQFKGYNNSQLPSDIWRAAHIWLSKHISRSSPFPIQIDDKQNQEIKRSQSFLNIYHRRIKSPKESLQKLTLYQLLDLHQAVTDLKDWLDDE